MKKNPLKNVQVLFRLNPYAQREKRIALIQVPGPFEKLPKKKKVVYKLPPVVPVATKVKCTTQSQSTPPQVLSEPKVIQEEMSVVEAAVIEPEEITEQENEPFVILDTESIKEDEEAFVLLEAENYTVQEELKEETVIETHAGEFIELHTSETVSEVETEDFVEINAETTVETDPETVSDDDTEADFADKIQILIDEVDSPEDSVGSEDDGNEPEEYDAAASKDTATAASEDDDDDDVVSEEDNVVLEEDSVSTEEDDVVSEEGGVVSEDDYVTLKDDDAASEEDDADSEENDAASEEDDAVSEEGGVVSEEDDAVLSEEFDSESGDISGESLVETEALSNEFKEFVRVDTEPVIETECVLDIEKNETAKEREDFTDEKPSLTIAESLTEQCPTTEHVLQKDILTEDGVDERLKEFSFTSTNDLMQFS